MRRIMTETDLAKKTSQAKQQKNGFALFLFILVILYDLSPIDLVPDILPGIGWLDDLVITVIASLNLVEKHAGDINETLGRFVWYVKWCLAFLGFIALALAGFSVYGLYMLATGS